VASGSWDISVFSFFLFSRITYTQTRAIITMSNITPPTMPPIMGPSRFVDLVDVDDSLVDGGPSSGDSDVGDGNGVVGDGNGVIGEIGVLLGLVNSVANEGLSHTGYSGLGLGLVIVQYSSKYVREGNKMMHRSFRPACYDLKTKCFVRLLTLLNKSF